MQQHDDCVEKDCSLPYFQVFCENWFCKIFSRLNCAQSVLYSCLIYRFLCSEIYLSKRVIQLAYSSNFNTKVLLKSGKQYLKESRIRYFKIHLSTQRGFNQNQEVSKRFLLGEVLTKVLLAQICETGIWGCLV